MELAKTRRQASIGCSVVASATVKEACRIRRSMRRQCAECDSTRYVAAKTAGEFIRGRNVGLADGALNTGERGVAAMMVEAKSRTKADAM